MTDRLGELLERHAVLYAMMCRDPTSTDIELIAQAGYHIVWLDLEHSPQSTTGALRLGRTIAHLGMVPMARILELSRTHVQRLLDGGMGIVSLPDIRSADQAKELVRLGKYPPMGQRGVSSNSAGTGYTLGADPAQTLRDANRATHLMTMFESDESFEQLDAILGVDGIDLFTIGPADWSVGLGLFGEAAKTHLAPKIERILTAARAAGKVTLMAASNADEARSYHYLGVRIFLAGIDVAIKRRGFFDALEPLNAALAGR